MLADYPSQVRLPLQGTYSSVLDFLCARFPRVPREVWQHRMQRGLVRRASGAFVSPEAPYEPGGRLYYFREVESEPLIPFVEKIVFQNEEILVACKPHFLPVIPSGPFVNECLLFRLRKRTGNAHLVPVNRLDRETAGLVLFSVNPATRRLYGRLFQNGQVQRVYEAIARPPQDGASLWHVESRITDGRPWFLSMDSDDPPPNSRTVIRLEEVRADRAKFILRPLTGKRHQLRLHMARIGCPILNDPLYPRPWDPPKTGFDRPLQLLARSLAFRDPITRQEMVFSSTRGLDGWR